MRFTELLPSIQATYPEQPRKYHVVATRYDDYPKKDNVPGEDGTIETPIMKGQVMPTLRIKTRDGNIQDVSVKRTVPVHGDAEGVRILVKKAILARNLDMKNVLDAHIKPKD